VTADRRTRDDELVRAHGRPIGRDGEQASRKLPAEQRYQRIGISLTPAQVAELHRLVVSTGDRRLSISDLVRLALEDLFETLELRADRPPRDLAGELAALAQREAKQYPGRRSRGMPQP
jgi:Arc/MetJ-type ribon-helix-helix transcriptional regulator